MSFVIASLDGRALLELRVTLRRGAEPSTFEAVLTGDAPAVGAPVVLRVADAGTARELRQFRVTRVENLGDGRSRVHGADARHEWTQRPVRASLNPAGGDGTAQFQALPLPAVLARLFALAGLNDAPGAPALVPRNVVCDGSLADAIELACARCGLTLGVNDAGAVLLEPAGEAFAPDAARLIAAADSGRAGPAAVIGGPALELARVTDWQAVIPGDGSAGFPAGEFHDLGRALAAWGIAETQARRAALHEGGFDALVPATSPNGAARLELLRRHAFRLFRARGFARPWLPVGGVNDDGTLAPPRLEAAMPRPRGFAPATVTGDSFDAGGFAPARDGFELDCERGLVRVQHPPYALSGGDATLQSRVLAGPPRLRLTIARPGALPPLQVGQGAALHAPHLVAVYDDGVMLNRAALEHGARALLQPPGPRAEYLLAGVDGALAVGGRVRVEIAADADGLRTRVVDAPPVPPPEGAVEPAGAAGDAVAPVPGGPHQPINAFRAGPLILRASGTAPETESAVAARAVARDPRTNNLQLDSFGPLAFPFHLDSLDPARHGRWFFVAGVEAVADGRLRVLAPDERHAPAEAAAFSPVRATRPEGLRGLLVSLGDGPGFVDAGPLVAHARGRDAGACSNLVADLDGPRLSETRRGGLQYLTVLALSPAHRGWVPALNLRDGDTQQDSTCGRGLYAEDDGRSLGRLAAHNQGGPNLADAAHCEKHAYGQAADDGLYRECAGHISTEAFFKIPRDPVHDAPLAFYPEPFEGEPPPWPPFEAQIKYDHSVPHRWNHQQRPGRWRIQYRVPFLPGLPPTWRPRIKEPPAEPPAAPRVPAMILPPESVRPAVSEHELWAPSHDWLPVPSTPEPERDLPLRGPAIASAGWAAEEGHTPDPGAGGGCVYLPPGRPLAQAQTDGGTRRTFLLLHPEVLLAFGLPHHGLGRAHSGWQTSLTDGDLAFTPVDADAVPDPERTLRVNAGAEIAGKLTVGGLIDPTGLELTPQASNPGGTAANTLWLDSGDSNRAKIGSNKLAYTSEVGEANTASNLGTGAEVFKDKSGVDLRFRRLNGGLNIDVSQSTNDITVALMGTVGVSNGGTGQTTVDGTIDAFLGSATARTPDKDSRLAARTGSGQGGYSTVENVLKALRTLTQKTSVIRTDRFLITDESASGAPKYVTLDDLHPNGQAYVMESVEYTGSGSSGKTVTLTGINRAHLLVFFNQSNTGSIWVYLAVPFGATGTVTARALADGSRVTSLSLDAPSAGTSQVLTISNTLSNFNASSNTYRLWVVGTPV